MPSQLTSDVVSDHDDVATRSSSCTAPYSAVRSLYSSLMNRMYSTELQNDKTTMKPQAPTVEPSTPDMQDMSSDSEQDTSSSNSSPRSQCREAKTHHRIETASYTVRGLKVEVDARYKIDKAVGQGAYGLVCSAEDTCAARSSAIPARDGRPTMVAIKKVWEPFDDHTNCKRLLREIRLLRTLRHPNVLHLTDMMPPPSLNPADWNDVYLVTRLFDTNLHRIIYSGHALTDAHVQYILWQVFRALEYLHAAGVVHRDIKPTNLLLNKDCELVLADLGLARYMPPGGVAPSPEPRSKSGQLTKYVVTRWYRAPELLVQNRTYDAKVDMWSAGCILAEVLGAKAIFPGKDSLHQLRLVVEHLGMPSREELSTIENSQAREFVKSVRPKQPPASSPAAAAERLRRLYPQSEPKLLDLLARLLQWDPAKRPNATEALAHPYFAAYHNAVLDPAEPPPTLEMDFEKQSPSSDDLRRLIWEEMVHFHPHLARNGAKSDAMDII